MWPSIVGDPSIQAGLARHVHALKSAHLYRVVKPLQRLSCFYRLFLDRHDVRHGCRGHVHDQYRLW